MKQVVNAVRGPQRRGRTLGEASADEGVEFVVNSVLMLPQQLHHWVVRLAEDITHMLVNNADKSSKFPLDIR